jgi:hypothetical protein
VGAFVGMSGPLRLEWVGGIVGIRSNPASQTKRSNRVLAGALLMK